MVKKKSFFFLLAAFLVAACAIQSNQNQVKAPIPSAAMAQRSGVKLEKLGEGYSLYIVHCAQCHELQMPKDMKNEEWHTILPGMAWNAGLKPDQEKTLLAYLLAATEQVSQKPR